MTDLDRDLAAMLQVDPSPEFVARVREHIDEQSACGRSSRMMTGWMIAAAVLIGVVVGAGVWFERPAPPTLVGAVPSTSRVPAGVTPTASPSNAEVQGHLSPRAADVLISPAEAAVVQRLLLAAREASFDMGESPAADMSPLDTPMPIVIESITVAPLMTADIDLGGQQ